MFGTNIKQLSPSGTFQLSSGLSLEQASPYGDSPSTRVTSFQFQGAAAVSAATREEEQAVSMVALGGSNQLYKQICGLCCCNQIDKIFVF